MMKRERVTVAPKETEVRSVDDVENQDWIYTAHSVPPVPMVPFISGMAWPKLYVANFILFYIIDTPAQGSQNLQLFNASVQQALA